ncbi:MAG: hypothetical protein E7653_06410 [Ruminococcaceae bacterium]|nr:hypothetical protein [Oscillospiraceae bacterium]
MEYIALDVSQQEMPLANELWLYFMDKYFDDSKFYPNLNIDGDDTSFIRLVIIGLFIGLSIAGFAAVFNKRVLGNFVRKLISEEALSPESAKTLEELGFAGKVTIYNAVRKSTTLRRVVKCREEQEYEAALKEKQAEYENARQTDKKLPKFKETEYKVDPTRDRFYIPEDMKYMADVKFDAKGNTWASAIFCCIFMLVLMVVAIILLPSILEFLNNLAAPK